MGGRVIRTSLVMAVALAGCELPPTVDTIDGTWIGALDEADLDRGVSVAEPGSQLVVTLYAVDDWGVTEQWADVDLEGALDFHGRLVKGGDPGTTSDVYLEDTLLRAEPRLDGIKVRMRGEFTDDFEWLDLDMRYFGLVSLRREDQNDHPGGTVGG
jgi:hypothetical protein